MRGELKNVIIEVYLINASKGAPSKGEKDMFFKSKAGYLTVEGSTVTSFDEYNCSNGVVVIPDYVTTIGRSAFARSSLCTVRFPSGLTTIDSYAFNEVWHLEEVVIPYGVRRIGDGAFAGCRDLKSVYIPDSVEYIGQGAFQDCENLRSVRLPSGLKEITAAMFERCYSLTTVTIPTSVEFIRGFAFAHSGLRSIALPRSVRNIAAQHLFAGCTDLTSVTMPSGFDHVVHLMEIPAHCRISYI